MAVTRTFKAHEAHMVSPAPLGYETPVAEPEPQTPVEGTEPQATEEPAVETADGVPEAEEPTEESAPEPEAPVESEPEASTPTESWTHAQIDAWANAQDPVVEYPRDANKADKLAAINAHLEGST